MEKRISFSLNSESGSEAERFIAKWVESLPRDKRGVIDLKEQVLVNLYVGIKSKGQLDQNDNLLSPPEDLDNKEQGSDHSDLKPEKDIKAFDKALSKLSF